jgi:hypothetical protein
MTLDHRYQSWRPGFLSNQHVRKSTTYHRRADDQKATDNYSSALTKWVTRYLPCQVINQIAQFFGCEVGEVKGAVVDADQTTKLKETKAYA